MTGSAPARLIRAHGSTVSVIDVYNRHAGTDAYGNVRFDRLYFERAETNAVVERAGTFTRSYLTSGGQVDSGEIMAFFPGIGPDGEPVIRDETSTDVPEDEQLPPASSDSDPSEDYYGATILNDTENGGSFDVVNIILEGDTRRVKGSLRGDPVEPTERPEPL